MQLKINGTVFNFTGNGGDIAFNGRTLFVNGREVQGIPEREDRQLIIEGNVNSLVNSGSAVIRGKVTGSIENSGQLRCDTINGDVRSSGQLSCISLRGNMYT